MRLRPLLIALDVDGTTVAHDGVTISPRVRSAVRAVRAAGHHVVLATGRSPVWTLPVAAALGLVGGFAVCSNGAVTLRLHASGADRCTVVADATFDPREVLEVLGRSWPGCAVAVEVPGAGGFRITDSFPRGYAGRLVVVPWAELGADGASRLVVLAGAGAAQIGPAVAHLLLDSVDDTIGTVGVVEITPRGVSKASALEALRGALGVAAVDTVAIGDHLNDIGMLGWAARGIAMGHAPAVVRQAADEVAPSYDDDGLAVVLEPLVAAVPPHRSRSPPDARTACPDRAATPSRRSSKARESG